ncbi:hypothetical protein MTO96_038748 [Rhipicephalus appendiculatus]
MVNKPGQMTSEWMECPVHNLLKRKVKCWNEDHGCDTVLSASELNKHFCKDCDHHSTSCPRCSMSVRCNNVCAHMQSKCRDHVMYVASGNPHTDTTGERALMMALNANIDTRLHKGVIDDVLQWPFKEKIRFTIKHPAQKKECTMDEAPAEGFKNFAKPEDGSNQGVYFMKGAFSIHDLEREGYVADDKLRVVLELISEN